jgi:hypothetical protein
MVVLCAVLSVALALRAVVTRTATLTASAIVRPNVLCGLLLLPQWTHTQLQAQSVMLPQMDH